MASEIFQPWNALIDGYAEATCSAVVTIPARNEETSICSTLNAFATQVDLAGKPLGRESFEILLLLNNCTDGSAKAARDWKKANPDVRLHVSERTFSSDEAFVGTARRLLMDTAWLRLSNRKGVCGVLSTDADTQVRADWIAQNISALEAGSDAVGGIIAMKEDQLRLLPYSVRRAYLRDCRYQSLVAELEDRLDPQPGDPWPRHLHHFGASLACTPETYARAGGMPPITPLEDVAFVDRLRRTGARLRHHPDVMVFTSSRMEGRVKVGLSGQFNIWREMFERGEQHRVQSAAWLSHRFRTLRKLRAEAASKGAPVADYLAEVDCDRRVAESFRGQHEGDITLVVRRLAALLRTLR